MVTVVRSFPSHISDRHVGFRSRGLHDEIFFIVSLFRGSSRSESLILSHHSRFECECNKEEINNDDDENGLAYGFGVTW